MGKTKKENLIFTTMMCALMVLGMTVYNVLLLEGFTGEAFKTMAIGYVPAFLVALILDIFIVGAVAKGIAGRLLKPGSPMIQKVLTISCFMVIGMVLLMSFYGAVTHVGFGPELGEAYVRNLWLNFICALPLQLAVVGPLTRAVFLKIFPPHASESQAAAA
ncbi:DUF2798 domain-containing protein [Saccharibacillus alkalitolerans]|uniref:DUF2798 domain-containing protein n=1 Tax=Saccharibacillus alkalitolerans TaxID=2705290 RepID=A0ABX0F2E5_9BACL|nr:DUF2798 domain-containing protein [Saccharibacillus alkalitolerans]NGZ74732.1 DUF2798 domain-containing protein [Saccharibacillus alkalitolerans]